MLVCHLVALCLLLAFAGTPAYAQSQIYYCNFYPENYAFYVNINNEGTTHNTLSYMTRKCLPTMLIFYVSITQLLLWCFGLSLFEISCHVAPCCVGGGAAEGGCNWLSTTAAPGTTVPIVLEWGGFTSVATVQFALYADQWRNILVLYLKNTYTGLNTPSSMYLCVMSFVCMRDCVYGTYVFLCVFLVLIFVGAAVLCKFRRPLTFPRARFVCIR